MPWSFNEIFQTFYTRRENPAAEGYWGLEREALRIDKEGSLAQTPHPATFGDKLTDSFITTDFSESQIEFITPPFQSIEASHNFLKQLHTNAARRLPAEGLWPFSMPPRLPGDNEIPIARYADTPKGKENEIYRKGLALRYGKKMQLISGVHYNFSFGEKFMDLLYSRFGKNQTRREFTDNTYFAMGRNIIRYRWLLTYLFGASPVMDSSFENNYIKRVKKQLGSFYRREPVFSYLRRHATSLRMSRFGYHSGLQENMNISYNSLSEYLRDIKTALSTGVAAYSKAGISKEGSRVQLNGNLLQKESEHYSPIRFKQTKDIENGLSTGLAKHGVQYLELRAIDLDPFSPVGITLEQLYFIHAFLIFCLFEPSPPLNQAETAESAYNNNITALSGRWEGLKLCKGGRCGESLKQQALNLLDKIRLTAYLLDKSAETDKYGKSISAQYEKLIYPELLPSAKIARELKSEKFTEFGLNISNKHLSGERV